MPKVEIDEDELKALRRSAALHDATCFRGAVIIRQALEDIAGADETSTLAGAVAIAKDALERSKR